ncbi:unnamed protein product [Peniophora sp. CBMAI 1063]|nr:unnamed protein product [Peniophora sp. CBMAI 1063]
MTQKILRTQAVEFEPAVIAPERSDGDHGSDNLPNNIVNRGGENVNPDKVLTKFGWERLVSPNVHSVLHEDWWGAEDFMPEELISNVRQNWVKAVEEGPSRVFGLPEALKQLGVLDADGKLPNCDCMVVEMADYSGFGPLRESGGALHLRPEYEKLWNDICRVRESFDGVFVAGHYKTGKTYAMVYLLTNFLRRSEPVLFRSSKDLYILFLSHGAYKLRDSERWDEDYVERLHHLVPSRRITALLKDVDTEIVPSFLQRPIFYPVIFGRPRRWKDAAQFGFFLYVMAPPSPREIIAEALIQNPGQETAKRGDVGVLNNLVKALTSFGANPFFVFQAALKPMTSTWMQDLDGYIDTLSLNQLKKLLKSCPVLDSQNPCSPSTLPLAVHDALITVNRLELPPTDSDVSQYFAPSIASPYIFHRLRRRMVALQREETRLMMQTLLGVGGLRTAGGIMFESLMHHLLSSCPSDWHALKDFKLVEFFPWTTIWNAKKARRAAWHLEVSHIVQKREEDLYDSVHPPPFDSAKYYVPQLVNNATFDAVTYVRIRRRRAPARASNSSATSNHPKPSPAPTHASFTPPTATRPQWQASPPGGIPDDRGSEVIVSTTGVRTASQAGLDSVPPPKKRSNDDSARVKVAIALQMTVASTHSLAESGLERLAATFDQSHEWAFVYVIPHSTIWNFTTMQTRIAKLHKKKPNLKLSKYRWYVLTANVDIEGLSGDVDEEEGEIEEDDSDTDGEGGEGNEEGNGERRDSETATGTEKTND